MNDVSENSTDLVPFSPPEISKDLLVKYAEASLDSNKIHIDESYAVSQGFPTVVVHGMLNMALIVVFLRRNFPEERYRLKNINTRFRRIVFPGEAVSCQGKSVQKKPGQVVVGFKLVNSKDETVLDGQACLEET